MPIVSFEQQSFHDFQLKEALLIYSSSGQRFNLVMRHNVLHDIGVQPQLGAGAPVTLEFLRQLEKQMRGDDPLEFLSEQVLAFNRRTAVWFVPPKRRKLYFHEQCGAELRALSGEEFPIPPLVFKVKDQQLSVRAITALKRPAADHTLRVAPFTNIYGDGTVCLGSVRKPNSHAVERHADWERAFFDSEFSHTVIQTSAMTRQKGGLLRLWQLCRTRARFPLSSLVPVKQNNQPLSLRDWINA